MTGKEKVLVTGGAGFIGSHTVRQLLAAGYAVRALDNLSPPVHEGNHEWPSWLPDEVERLEGDVRRPEDWAAALEGVDFVIHLAAYQDLLPDFSKFFSVNATGTALLYETIVARKLPVRKVLIASSQFVYGEGQGLCAAHGEVSLPGRNPDALEKGLWEPVCPLCGGPVETQPLRENHAAPNNQYAISKYSQELTAIAIGRNYGIPSVALRYSIVQGPHQSFRNAYSGVMRVFTLQLLNGQRPTVFEDGSQKRDFVNVTDVAGANLLVLKNPEADYQVFNVGGGKAWTVVDFARLAAEVTGRKIEPRITGEYRVGDTRHSFSDISKIQRLGWQPSKTVRESIEEYSSWITSQRLEIDYVGEALRNLRTSGILKRPSPV
ncbi:MAG: NAD-dependent epimerase/dehydratase family protein [Verrucomicrobiae bacterium]|nr:NAD-dependent epimerase/dehydratase family protein [Verrucomicrobiae bacterium]